jgi:hypothetical protein
MPGSKKSANIKYNKRVHFVTVNYRPHKSIRRVKIKTILIILAGLLIGCSDFNTEPVITSLTADNTTVSPGGTVLLTCTAEDDNDDSLAYIWECTNGSLVPNGSTATWTAPGSPGTYSISCAVTDGNDGSTMEIIDITVL